MWQQRWTRYLALTVGIAAVVAAVAQGPNGFGNAGAGAAGGAGAGQMGGPGGPPGGGPGGGPSMAVTEDAVFVLMGPRIMRLNPKTLKIEATAELPRPTPPAGGGPGGMGGPGGGMPPN
jgi:hypothetical protein